jgi:leucyl-tRNA synthetase
MKFKEALKVSFYNMQDARDRDRAGTMQVGVDETLVRRWAEWQALMMVPITPHWSEAMWELLGKSGCVVLQRWPQPEEMEDADMTAAGSYLFGVAHSLAASLANREKKKKPAKGKEEEAKPNSVNLYVATTFPRWKETVLELLREHFDASTSEVSKAVMPVINKHEGIKSFNKGKLPAQFAAMIMDEAKTKGAGAFALKMPFDEVAVLTQNNAYLASFVGVASINIFTDAAGQEFPDPDVQERAVPGKPEPHFFFDGAASASTVDKPASPAKAPAAAAKAPVAVPDVATSAAPAAASASAAPRVSVFDFLEKHEVARVLNDAVNALGTEQPTDPYKWLAKRLHRESERRGEPQ